MKRGTMTRPQDALDPIRAALTEELRKIGGDAIPERLTRLAEDLGQALSDKENRAQAEDRPRISPVAGGSHPTA